jgi:hypothetical protein
LDKKAIIEHELTYKFDKPKLKTMKKLLIINVLLIFVLSTKAQFANDAVYLHGGSILKGTIIENTDSLLKIKITGGNIFAFQPSEIKKISVQGSHKNQNKQIIHYQCILSVGTLVGSSKNEKEAPISLLTEQNLGIGEHFSFGLTTGLEIPNESVIPIGGNVKGFRPINSGNILFAGLSGGYLKSLEKPYDPYDMMIESTNGTFANAEIGIIFNSTSTANLFIAFGYRYAELHYKLNDWWYTEVEENKYFNRFAVRVGIFI